MAPDPHGERGQRRWQAAPLPVYLTYPHAQFYPSRLVRFAAMMREAVPGLVEGRDA